MNTLASSTSSKSSAKKATTKKARSTNKSTASKESKMNTNTVQQDAPTQSAPKAAKVEKVFPKLSKVDLTKTIDGLTLAKAMPELVKDGQDWRAHEYKDQKVVAEFATSNGIADGATICPWPGPSNCVNYWVLLENGRAVGLHEGPKNGLAYHIVGRKSMRQLGLID